LYGAVKYSKTNTRAPDKSFCIYQSFAEFHGMLYTELVLCISSSYRGQSIKRLWFFRFSVVPVRVICKILAAM